MIVSCGVMNSAIFQLDGKSGPARVQSCCWKLFRATPPKLGVAPRPHLAPWLPGYSVTPVRGSHDSGTHLGFLGPYLVTACRASSRASSTRQTTNSSSSAFTRRHHESDLGTRLVKAKMTILAQSLSRYRAQPRS